MAPASFVMSERTSTSTSTGDASSSQGGDAEEEEEDEDEELGEYSDRRWRQVVMTSVGPAGSAMWQRRLSILLEQLETAQQLSGPVAARRLRLVGVSPVDSVRMNR